MANWSGKTRGGAFGYRFFILLIKNSNLKVTYSFMRIVAFYFYLFNRNKSVEYYFKNIHGYSGKRLRRSIYQNYVLFGEVLIDKIAFMVRPKVNFTFDYDGEEYLREMVSNGEGGILIGAHMGNWELAGNLLDRIDTKVNVLMHDAEHENIKALFDNYQIVRKFNIIPIKEDFSHLQKIKEVLKNKEFVVMHGDRFMEGNDVVETLFMGQPADFPVGPLYMAAKFQAPVSFVFTVKESSNHYHFYASSPKIHPYPGNLKTRKEELKEMVYEYASHLETMVKKYPTQWFNHFPFWKEEIN
ncbi:MAG TPA: lysophospholipid acyltransferase family protein [Marinilabiliaceae bacterium]|nr:lysophospholipid acyltransferase family protein [Marinilabiliaceae bacterium]